MSLDALLRYASQSAERAQEKAEKNVQTASYEHGRVAAFEEIAGAVRMAIAAERES